MPTYEYQCKTCGHRFERFQKMTDPSVSECPECGKAVRKVIHPPAIAFKGSGFYVNDYKGNGKPEKRSEDKGAASEKTPETKPAAETTAAPESAKPDSGQPAQ